MATRLMTMKAKPRRQPPPEPEKPKGKPLIQVLTDDDMDSEVKFDPNLGTTVKVEPKQYKLYPSAEVGARVAKCYVCKEVKNKEVMLCIGQNNAEKGSLKYVWRCKEMKAKDGHIRAKGCEAGSESWLKHFAHKTPMGKLWGVNPDGTREKRKGLEEEALVIGTQIIEKIKEKYSKEISERLKKRDKKREEGKKLYAKLKETKSVREVKPERRPVVAPVAAPAKRKKAKRSWRNVVIRRS